MAGAPGKASLHATFARRFAASAPEHLAPGVLLRLAGVLGREPDLSADEFDVAHRIHVQMETTGSNRCPRVTTQLFALSIRSSRWSWRVSRSSWTASTISTPWPTTFSSNSSTNSRVGLG